jgi:hypothetical protein
MSDLVSDPASSFWSSVSIARPLASVQASAERFPSTGRGAPWPCPSPTRTHSVRPSSSTRSSPRWPAGRRGSRTTSSGCRWSAAEVCPPTPVTASSRRRPAGSRRPWAHPAAVVRGKALGRHRAEHEDRDPDRRGDVPGIRGPAVLRPGQGHRRACNLGIAGLPSICQQARIPVPTERRHLAVISIRLHFCMEVS